MKALYNISLLRHEQVSLMKLLKQTSENVFTYTKTCSFLFWDDIFTNLFAICAEGAIQGIPHEFQTNSISLSNSNEIGTHNDLVRKRTLNHLAKLAKWLSCVMSTVHLTVCSYYVTYESTVCSYLNAKELFAQNRRDIWSLSSCNETRNHNHSVCKHLFRLQTKWLWLRAPLQSLKLQISSLFQARSYIAFRQLLSVDSLWRTWHNKKKQSNSMNLFKIRPVLN